MSFTIKPATRVGIIPLIAVYAESGNGKTMSALLLARGIVGPIGKIVMVDTESRRGSLYADVIPGGYDVLDLDEPFTPERYMEASRAAVEAGAQIIVYDSASHEWEGIGGTCDQAAENENKSGRSGLHNWKTPKLEHQKLVQFWLRSPIPVVFCIRAKFKTRQKKENGKTVIVRDEFVSPIQAEDFIYEMTAHLQINPDHTIVLTKCSHPALRGCFPEDNKGMIETKHGEAIAKWCASPGGTQPAASATSPDLTALKKQLWALVGPKVGGDKTQLARWLIDEACMDPAANLTELTAPELASVIKLVEKKVKI